MEHADLVPKYLHGRGVEIGAFKTPIPGISPIYVDRFDQYANERTLAEYYGDACDLPFLDSSLDYVATSHVIEHVADPVSAFKEWCRVLRNGGIIYMVVPDRRLTFDHPRALTPVEHMLEDHVRRTTQVDGTHIDDFVFGVDWSMFEPGTPPEQATARRQEQAGNYRDAIAEGREINIHFHTFERDQMLRLLAAANEVQGMFARIDVLETHERFSGSRPDGFLIIARVEKPPVRRSLSARVGDLFAGPRSLMKPEARRF